MDVFNKIFLIIVRLMLYLKCLWPHKYLIPLDLKLGIEGLIFLFFIHKKDGHNFQKNSAIFGLQVVEFSYSSHVSILI